MMTAMLAIGLIDGLAKHASVNYSPPFVPRGPYAGKLVLPFAAAVNGHGCCRNGGSAHKLLGTLMLVTAMTFSLLARS